MLDAKELAEVLAGGLIAGVAMMCAIVTIILSVGISERILEGDKSGRQIRTMLIASTVTFISTAILTAAAILLAIM
jgi:hypothetical protein